MVYQAKQADQYSTSYLESPRSIIDPILEDEEEEQVESLAPIFSYDIVQPRRLSFSEELVRHKFVPFSPVAHAINREISAELKRTHDSLVSTLRRSPTEQGQNRWVPGEQSPTSSTGSPIRKRQRLYHHCPTDSGVSLTIGERDSWGPMVDDLADFLASNGISEGRMETGENDLTCKMRRGTTVVMEEENELSQHLLMRGGGTFHEDRDKETLAEITQSVEHIHLRGGGSFLQDAEHDAASSVVASWYSQDARSEEVDGTGGDWDLRDPGAELPKPPETLPAQKFPGSSAALASNAYPQTPYQRQESASSDISVRGQQNDNSLLPSTIRGYSSYNERYREVDLRPLYSPFPSSTVTRHPMYPAQGGPLSDLWDKPRLGNDQTNASRNKQGQVNNDGIWASSDMRSRVYTPVVAPTGDYLPEKTARLPGLGGNPPPLSLRQNRPTRAAQLPPFNDRPAMWTDESPPSPSNIGPYPSGFPRPVAGNEGTRRAPSFQEPDGTGTIERSLYEGPGVQDPDASISAIGRRAKEKYYVQRAPFTGLNREELGESIDTRIRQAWLLIYQEWQPQLKDITNRSDWTDVEKRKQIARLERVMMEKYREAAKRVTNDGQLNQDEVYRRLFDMSRQANLQSRNADVVVPSSRPAATLSTLGTVGKKIGRMLRYALAVPDDPDLKSYSNRRPSPTFPTGVFGAVGAMGGIQGRVPHSDNVRPPARATSRSGVKNPDERLRAINRGDIRASIAKSPGTQAICGETFVLPESTPGSVHGPSQAQRRWVDGRQSAATTGTQWPTQSEIYGRL